MTVSTGDYIRANVRLESQGSDLVNSYSFACSFASSMSDEDFMDALASQFGALYTNISGQIHSGVVAKDITAYEVAWDPATGEEVIIRLIGVEGISWTFTGTGDAEPLGLCALVSFGTAAIKTRLRKYISGLVEGAWDGDSWYSALLTVLGDYAADLLAGLVLAVGNELLYGSFSKSAGGAFALATGAVVSGADHYQRRRRPGVGS